jgi:S-adenosylmethionine:tRNA ribosyltransferase-isomerase
MPSVITFDLPKELIAQEPASPRDHARLLVYSRQTREIIDDYFYNLLDYLNNNTTVVVNNSKVEYCRYLFDGDKTELFAVEKMNDRTIRALVRPGKRFRLDATAELGGGLTATIKAIDDDGLRTIEFNTTLDDERLVAASHIPLPPYIRQNDTLATEYQTIYAKPEGSLAAPTAGLHFTPKLREAVMDNFGWEELTLHVGLGTFAPLKDENFSSGKLHSEAYEVAPDVFERIKNASHITAVGTTSARTLETLFSTESPVLRGETSIFIHDNYYFKRIDSLITNFHLPGTSLLLMVASFIGSEDEVRRIYDHAIKQKYRFYSFGDAMLLL